VSDKFSLLDLAKAGGFEASLVTTYAVSFDVYEQLLLRKLVSAGCRYNILLADHNQVAKAWETPELRPVLAGTAYSLAPIRMGGAFHPKIWLLAGRKKALLAVGSHNITLAGLGYNRELSTVVQVGLDTDAALDGLIGAAWRTIRAWVEGSRSLPPMVKQAVYRFEEFVGPYTRPSSPSPKVTFHVQGLGKTSLFNSVEDILKGQVRRIAVLGPFFDTRYDFLGTLRKRWPNAKTVIGITPEALTSTAILNGKYGKCVDARCLGGIDRGGYVHAKALYLEGAGGEHLLAIGSANPSSPAWTLTDHASNAEAAIVWQGALAKKLADQLGLLTLFSRPQLKAAAVEIRKFPDSDQSAREAGGRFIGVAGLDAQTRSIQVLVGSHIITGYSLHAANDTELGSGEVSGTEQLIVLIPDSVNLSSIQSIKLNAKKKQQLFAVVHHNAAIAPLCTGNVREQVKRALAILTSDEGNLAEVIDAVHKVIFEEEPQLVVRVQAASGASQVDHSAQERTRPETLEVSAAEMSQLGRKVRALKAGDLSYLIDVLIRRLALTQTTSAETVDKKGRNEEEQVGADDDDSVDPAQTGAQAMDDAGLAMLIAGKVKRLMWRMSDFMERAAVDDGKAPAAVVRLVAVLALLRELRRIESLPRWKTARLELVPLDVCEVFYDNATDAFLGDRHRLLMKFESASGQNTEEAGQLRALLGWLAWDIGAAYRDQFPIEMEVEERDLQVHTNASLFELLPRIVAEESDLAVLKQSVDLTVPRTNRALNGRQKWWADHIALAQRWNRLKAIPFNDLKRKPTIEVGDIATTLAASKGVFRIVAAVGDNYVDLSTIDGVKSFTTDRIYCIQ
jgi:hypothetical protein